MRLFSGLKGISLPKYTYSPYSLLVKGMSATEAAIQTAVDAEDVPAELDEKPDIPAD
jgi:hypothetical protein